MPLRVFAGVGAVGEESLKDPIPVFGRNARSTIHDVDSATIFLRRRQEALLPAEHVRSFQRLVKLAFSERRKMMAKLLKRQWPAEKVGQALDQLGISLQARAQTVSLEQFVALTKLLA